MIPVDQETSNEFSLKPYEQSYYLACAQCTGKSTDKAVLREGSKEDEQDYETFKVEK